MTPVILDPMAALVAAAIATAGAIALHFLLDPETVRRRRSRRRIRAARRARLEAEARRRRR